MNRFVMLSHFFLTRSGRINGKEREGRVTSEVIFNETRSFNEAGIVYWINSRSGKLTVKIKEKQVSEKEGKRKRQVNFD